MPKKQTIQVPAIPIDIRPMRDGSVRLLFETPELDSHDAAILWDALRAEGWLLFKPNEAITLPELPEGVAEAGAKSPSQRLRSVMYLWWKQEGEKGSFDAFYLNRMEQAINTVKEKLDKEERQ